MEEIHYATFKEKRKGGNGGNSPPPREKRSKRLREMMTVQSTKEDEYNDASVEMDSSMINSDTMFEASKKVDKNLWSAAEQLMEAMASMRRRSTKIKPTIDIDCDLENNSSQKLHARWLPVPSPPLISAHVDSITGIITIPASSLTGPEMHGKGLVISPMNSAKNSFRLSSSASPVPSPSVSRRGSKRSLMPTIQSALNFGECQEGDDDEYCVGVCTER